MRLSQIFTGESKISDAQNVQLNAPRAEAIARQIRALVPGQTLQGELVARNGSDVQIKLAEDFLLNAKLDQNMNLEIGKNLTFEVKNNGRTLTLSPLFTNLATDANAVKALDMASLPVNEETLAMTRSLMQEGLSIDKNSLQTIYREGNLFPQADIKDIIYLHKLNLPVNESNVTQMISYRNLSYQLEAGVQDILNAVADTIAELSENGQTKQVSFLQEQLQSLVEGIEASLINEETTAPDTAPVPEESVQAVWETNEQSAIPGRMEAVLAQEPEKNPVTDNPISPQSEIKGNEHTLGEAVEKESTAPQKMNQEQTNQEQIKQEQVPKSQNPLPISESTSENSSGHIKHAVARELPEKLLELLDDLKEQWSVNPKDVADADKMTEFYRRMDRQLKALSQTLETVGQSNSPGAKAVNNLTQNLDFLQQINQMYSYVQLPLRLQQGEAHGDLYVYTNKRNLSAKDGQVSALLHLDMEHLGPMDVYVVLQQENVSTKFYLQDDEMLDFINDHMNVLTDRLTKRGYHCSVSALVRDEKELKLGGVDKLLQEEGQVPISEYAFDVRT